MSSLGNCCFRSQAVAQLTQQENKATPLQSLAQAQTPSQPAAIKAARNWRALPCLQSLDGTYESQQATRKSKVNGNTHTKTLAPQLLTLGTLLVARPDCADKKKL